MGLLHCKGKEVSEKEKYVMFMNLEVRKLVQKVHHLKTLEYLQIGM